MVDVTEVTGIKKLRIKPPNMNFFYNGGKHERNY